MIQTAARRHIRHGRAISWAVYNLNGPFLQIIYPLDQVIGMTQIERIQV